MNPKDTKYKYVGSPSMGFAYSACTGIKHLNMWMWKIYIHLAYNKNR